MEAAPPSPFVVAKAEFLFEVLIVALNTPSQLRQVDHRPARRGSGQGAQPVFRGFWLTGRPLDEAPLLSPRL